MKLRRLHTADELYAFSRNDGTNKVMMRCKAASSVYIKDKSRRIDLDILCFADEVRAIEAFVTLKLNKPVTHGCVSVESSLLRDVKIPCKYGHVIIPITGSNGRRITTFDISLMDTLDVVLELKTVWAAATHCGLTWVLHSIKKTDTNISNVDAQTFSYK